MSQTQKDPDRGQINFRYPPEKVELLRDKAQEEGVKLSALIARLCDEYLGVKPKSVPDADERLARIEDVRLARIEEMLRSIEGKLPA